jgi:hypothetical protein
MVLFNYDWDRTGFGRWRHKSFPMSSAGFDLFSFPSNAHLVELRHRALRRRLARQAKRKGWRAVVSNHEQFGALAAALLAERMGWPGTPVNAVLACQHKLQARRLLQSKWRRKRIPASNCCRRCTASRYPTDLRLSGVRQTGEGGVFGAGAGGAQPRRTGRVTRFSWSELWVIRHLVEPFERVAANVCRRPAARIGCCWNSRQRRRNTTSTATSSTARCGRWASSNR